MLPLARYMAAEAVAIDTETMGLVLGRDRLCLVQLCDSQGFISAIRIKQRTDSSTKSTKAANLLGYY